MLLDLRGLDFKILCSSQKGQDYFLDILVKKLNISNKFCIEFGAYDGWSNLNCAHLIFQGWNSLLIDDHYENIMTNLYREFLTAENVVDIFKKYNAPKHIGVLSVDIDGNDYWLLKEIVKEYTSDIIIVETNARFDTYDNRVHKYNPSYIWDKGWSGASPYAFVQLLREQYTPVYLHLDDLFFVHNSVLEKNNITCLEWKEIHPGPNLELYREYGDVKLIPEDWS